MLDSTAADESTALVWPDVFLGPQMYMVKYKERREEGYVHGKEGLQKTAIEAKIVYTGFISTETQLPIPIPQHSVASRWWLGHWLQHPETPLVDLGLRRCY